jgi:hypothetical protein
MDGLLFPEEALDVLRRAAYHPDAERSYEAMSGSFWWSDELVREASYACRRHGSWAFRYLMGYRASVIRDAPDPELLPVWEQVTQECPGWPGLRIERNSPALLTELHRASRRQCAEFLRMEQELRIEALDA